MRIDSSGRVGIGTTSPAAKLQVAGSTHVTGQDSLGLSAIQFSFSAPEGHIKVKNSSGNEAANLAFHTTDSTGNTNRVMHLKHDGKIGIGTTSPSQRVHIFGTSASVQTEESGGGIVRMQSGGTTGNIGMYSNHALLLRTNSLERMRIDSSGNVGIGSSTINLLNSNRTTLNINGTNETALCFNRSDTITGFLFTNSGEFRIQAEPGASNIVKIRNNNGTIAQFDDDGIKFNEDTATDNALDDYEEGTFSATASASGYSGGSAISMSGEQYTKIGRLVFFRMHLTVASSLSDADLSITGLPFTASKESVVNFAWQDAASFNGGQGIITGTQCVRFNGVFPTHSSGNATIRFSGTYNV